MSGESNNQGKRASLDLFVPPSETGSGGGVDNDAKSYLEQRRQKLQQYVREAKKAQQTIDSIRKTEEAINKVKKG
jgi:hypothetical protein